MQSIRELYKIGNGPSSSHTMGPKRAAEWFKNNNQEADKKYCEYNDAWFDKYVDNIQFDENIMKIIKKIKNNAILKFSIIASFLRN